MNKQELYDYILKHMTAEEALMKLLESSLVNYEKLKFESPEKAVHPIMIVTFAAFDMDWGLVIEGADKQKNMRGMSIGNKEYMDDLFGGNIKTEEVITRLESIQSAPTFEFVNLMLKEYLIQLKDRQVLKDDGKPMPDINVPNVSGRDPMQDSGGIID